MGKKIFIIIMMFFTLGFLLFNESYAQTMSNDSYKIVPDEPYNIRLNTSSTNSPSSSPPVNAVESDEEAGTETKKTGTNYSVVAGFEASESKNPFSFSISTDTLSFGDLVAGEPLERNLILKIANPSSFGYQIFAYENKSLKNSEGKEIPDTTCDTGSCTQTTASPWENPLTYGFGIRCENIKGSDCMPDFAIKNYYRSLANLEAKENPSTIILSRNSSKDKENMINHKINISGTQTSGIYQNDISYIALPLY